MKTEVIHVREPLDPSLFEAPGRALRNGQVVAFPTETVYGLGASAFLPDAVRTIFRLKGRPSDNPLIVHLASVDDVGKAAIEIPPVFYTLYEAFSPGPLTYVMSRNRVNIPDEVCRLSTVAVRFPSHAASRALIEAAGVPIVAPSANLSGKPSPTRAEHVLHDFDGKIPYVIDGGPCEVGVESTVIDLLSDPIRILRPGYITAEMIFEKTGLRAVYWRAKPGAKEADTPPAPGMKYRHYAPSARVSVVMPRDGEPLETAFFDALQSHTSEKTGIFTNETTWRALAARLDRAGDASRAALSPYLYGETRDIRDATRHLFDAFRSFDDQQMDAILAEGFVDPAAAGYMDRLNRAAAGSSTSSDDGAVPRAANGGEPVETSRTVLFLCTGNTCRSPVAEALFNARKVPGWTAISAGLAAYPGMPISPQSANVLGEWGIPSDAHRAQPIGDDLMAATDLIIPMTDAHRRILVNLYPERQDDIVSFSAFTDDGRGIDDPYGGSVESYRAMRDRVSEGIDRLIRDLGRRG